MRFVLLFALSLLCVCGPARAQPQPEPSIAPIPDWVERIPVPAPDPALRDRPAQQLLMATQSLYGTDHIDHFVDLAMLVQNAQGMQALGTIALPWQPGRGELIIHQVRIIRGATVIDLLANGQRFTVLRRENNLESAVLDGTLTAVMQAEGLTIGDILEVSFTMRLHGGTLPLRAENGFLVTHGQPIRHRYIRQIWPTTMPIQWHASGLFQPARIRTTRLGTELLFDQMNVEGPEVPANAPVRFQLPDWLQLTQYRNWAEVSALLSPHYDQAAQLAPDAPLRQEIARIAAASQDPRARTMAALRLVQDQVRYFALLIGDGNYLPATADQSWSRRFADCKGKSALLLALLRNLGVDAEPVLVNAVLGDSLGDRLPLMALFNHVIVRARIGGRSYCLDGTRTGDRDLDDLASSTFAWGLPLRAAGASLEAIPYSPPAQPLIETDTQYDGSGGLQGKVPVRIERTFRGEIATAWHLALSQAGREAFLSQVRQEHDVLADAESELLTIDVRDDPDHGTFTLIYGGRTPMSWARAPGAAAQRFRFDNDTISWDLQLDRPAGPYHDVPYAFTVPSYLASTETVILPHGGQGFTIEGQSLDHVVAGTRISRQLSIVNGRAVARSEFRRMEREVSAAVARDSLAMIGTIKDDQAYLRAAVGTMPFVPPQATRNPPPNDAEALVRYGDQEMNLGRNRPALADFDRAVAIAPQWSLAHADRGIALIHLNRLDEAEASLATALRLDDTEATAHQGKGFLELSRGHAEEAIREFSRSLELLPGNSFTLAQRAEAHEQLGQFAEALADFDAMIAAEPDNAAAHAARARILIQQGHDADALAAIDRAIAADPGNFSFTGFRGDLLARLGRTDDARAAYQSALAMFDRMMPDAVGNPEISVAEPRLTLLVRLGRQAEAIAATDVILRRYPGTVMMLAYRCFIRAQANVELALAQRDCDQALRAEPDHPIALPARGVVELRTQRWADAIRDFTRTLAGEPGSPQALFGRGIARIRSGDAAGGRADLAAARRLAFDVEWDFRRLGIELPAEASPPVASAAATAAAH